MLTGRCLPYGRGITFWPLAEVLRHAAGLLGVSGADGTPSRCHRPCARAFEVMAARRPLVVVLDDLHWAEPTPLDLVEHVAEWSRAAPMLLCCLARPEPLDRRPSWDRDRPGATTTCLEPLDRAAGSRLLAALLDHGQGRAALEERVADQLLGAADGNPLFLEELVAMLVDERQAVGGEAGRRRAHHRGLTCDLPSWRMMRSPS